MKKHKNSDKVKDAGKKLSTSKDKTTKYKSSKTLNNHKKKYHK